MTSERWEEYYKIVERRPPRDTLVKALEISPEANGKIAIDLGAGVGNDTNTMIESGWEVKAIDAEENSIKFIKNRIGENPRLKTQVASFENLDLDIKVDLINASFSLPFCHPDKFEGLWKQILSSLRKGGIFSGHLFGINDEWGNNSEMTFHSKDEILKMFDGFEMKMFEEKDEDGTTANGTEKHWHYFSIVAQKSDP